MSDNTNIAPMPKRSSHAPLSRVTSLQDAFDHPDFKSRIAQAVPKHLSPDRMLAVFVQAVQKTPKLRECGIMSLLGAFLSVASVGLEPNTALQHAHLIPFEKRKKEGNKWVTDRVDVQVIFGYQGLLELAYRSGLLRSVHADVVWPDEAADREYWDCWYGTGGRLIHRPKLGLSRPEGTLPALAYMHANLKNEGEAFEVMSMADVARVRNSAQAYQTAIRAKEQAERDGWKSLPATYTEAPWIKHPIAMIRKTVFRAGSKWLPKSIELAAAIQLDELQDRRTANFGAVIEGSADVLTTGLDALPDEATDRMDMGLGGDFTGYSQRQPEAAQASPAHNPPPAQEQRPAPAAARFEAYLVDEVGEVVSDVYTDPGLWAEGYGRLHELSTDWRTLAENNAEALAAARAFPNAAGLLDQWAEEPGRLDPGQPKAATAPDPAAAAMPLAKGGRGPDVTGWIKGAVAAIGTMEADVLASWVANNEATYRAFPGPRRLEIQKAIAARCQALGIPATVGMQASARPAQAAPGLPLGDQPEDDDAWSYEAIGQLGPLTTEADLMAFAAQIRPRALEARTRTPAAWKRVDDALAAKLEAARRHGK